MLNLLIDTENQYRKPTEEGVIMAYRVRINRVKFAAALARADLTVNQVAELSGVSRVTVSGVKSGKSCSKGTAEKLARVLGRDIIQDATAIADNAN